MKKTAVVLFVLALLSAGRYDALSRPREVPYATPAGEVKLVSFNIRLSGLDKKDGPDRWVNRRDAVAEMFVRESPSVVGLQEAMPDQLQFIEHNFPQFERIGVGRDDGVNGGECMAIFYRSDIYEAVAYGTFWLSETPDTPSKGWDALCKRTVTWVHLRERTTGKSFWYLNTHFDHRGPEARRMSAVQIAEFVAANIPAEATVVVGGDLNSDISNPIFDPLKAMLDVAREISDPSDFGGTFNGFGSAPDTIVLDHIFCRNTDADSTPSLRVLRDDFGAPYISDHYPVEFVFRLP